MIIIIIIFIICIAPFPKGTKRCCLLLLPCKEIITIISLHLGEFATGHVHALLTLLDRL